jgi:ketosteroid isomerase-like protein
MSKSFFYYYVGSKEALFDAAVTEGGAARPGPAPVAGPGPSWTRSAGCSPPSVPTAVDVASGRKRTDQPAMEAFTMPGTGKATVETLQRLLDAFNAHDLDAVMSFFVDDPVLEMPRGPHPWGRRFQGLEEVRAGLASRFAGLPDVHYGEDRHWVGGDRGCSEWLLTGTTPQGDRVEVRGCDLFEFRGDKIARKDSYWKLVER